MIKLMIMIITKLADPCSMASGEVGMRSRNIHTTTNKRIKERVIHGSKIASQLFVDKKLYTNVTPPHRC